jgi:hypothetical protein
VHEFLGPPGLVMADADIPDKFWPAIRLVVNNLVWILPLLAIEQAATGEVRTAVILGVLFVVDLGVAVKWGLLEGVARKLRRMSGAQLTLLVSIMGAWVFLTLCLGAVAWMLWTNQGFASAGHPAAVDEGPIRWTAGPGIEGDLATKIFSMRFIGVNISKTKALQLKDGNIISAIDGTVVPLEIEAVGAGGENKIVPISQIQLIPPGARIELVAKFGPPDPAVAGHVLGMDPKSFLEKWRQFSFNVTDDVRTYRLDFNDSHMIPFFHGKVGPRVTVKP